jgi:signal transduction histidine kinase
MLRRVLISVLILVPILALSGVLYGVEVRHDRIIREEGNAMRTLARLLVEAHGGAIGADSAPGQGTTISFTLPIPTGE